MTLDDKRWYYIKEFDICTSAPSGIVLVYTPSRKLRKWKDIPLDQRNNRDPTYLRMCRLVSGDLKVWIKTCVSRKA
jgi:hypothetical protein